MTLLTGVLCAVFIVLLAIWWNVWTIRNELNQNLRKMVSELTQMGQSLQKKPGGN